ncbi:MAG: hypothetical protein RMJ54_13030, partial [Roseiflexaceae bacterium]|nr:hypothetical protein [Roseiflexaceae bacterium]
MAPRILFCVLSILGLLAGMVGTTALASAPVAGRAEGASPAPLINPDGTLRLDGTVSGVLDTHGWQVTLDPERGPVFAPQSADPQWRNLGDAPAPAISSSVLAIAVSGNNVYIGGSFTDAGGVPEADYIARWDGARWHALGSGLNGSVTAIAISGNNVFVGGTFLNAGGVPEADYVARWDGSQWHALGSSGGNGPLELPPLNPLYPNPPVSAIAVSGNNVYIGGTFLNAGGVPEADYIAHWDGSQWRALGGSSGNGPLELIPVVPSSPISDIAISGSNVYIGGTFLNAGGVAEADYIARWNTATRSWYALGGSGGNGPIAPPGSGFSSVRALAVSGGNVYVSGLFTSIDGLTGVNYIARWDGERWQALGSGLNAAASDIAISGNDVYVGGSFISAGGVPNTSYIARWNGETWNALENSSLLQPGILAIAVNADGVYVSGSFSPIGELELATYFARWNPATARWSAVGRTSRNALNARVTAIAISQTDVYVGGHFTDAGGVPEADYIARWDGRQWHALGGNNGNGPLQTSSFLFLSPVSTLAIQGDDVYVGGYFFNAGGVPEADYIARWDGSNWHALGSSDGNSPLMQSDFSLSPVQAIAVSGNDVYVGGAFLNAGGVPEADYIARWDGTRWYALGGSSGNGPLQRPEYPPFYPVSTIAISGNNVYVGGYFTNAGGVPEADYIARWDGVRWYALGGSNSNGPFSPVPENPVNFVNIRDIATSGSNVYVGGAFLNAGGVPEADYIARWDGTHWHALGGSSGNGPLNPTSAGRIDISAISVNENNTYVGGWFENAGGVPEADDIARWDGRRWYALGSSGGAGPLTYADPGLSPAQALVASENDVYVGGSFTDAGGVALADYAAVYATPPAVTSITRLDASPTSAATVAYRVTFSETVTGVEANDFSLTATGEISGAVVASVI